MSVPDARRVKDLEDENQRVKQMVAEQALDLQAVKAVIARYW
jgi:putative transposase